jgi:hypothetical protein
MDAPDRTSYPNTPTRSLAGVAVPDTPLIARAIEYSREHSEPYLFNHAMRSWPMTTYDNFARDFGERFVPGLQETVDSGFSAERAGR